jgi:hypothetical protein
MYYNGVAGLRHYTIAPAPAVETTHIAVGGKPSHPSLCPVIVAQLLHWIWAELSYKYTGFCLTGAMRILRFMLLIIAFILVLILFRTSDPPGFRTV